MRTTLMRVCVCAAVLVACARPAAAEEGGGSPAVSAGEAPRYTLEDCLRVAMERSLTMGGALRDEELARAAVKKAASQAYPSLDASGVYTRLDEAPAVDFGGTSIELGQLDNYSASLNFSQLLYSGGTVRAAIRAAKLLREYAGLHTAHVRGVLERDVQAGFHGLLLLESVVKVREASVEQLGRLVDQTEARFGQHAASEFERLAARVKLANERPRLLQASNDLAVARSGFRALLNLDAARYELNGRLEPASLRADPAELIGQAVARRPDVRQMELMVRMLELDVKASRASYKPTLRAVASYSGGNSYGGMPTGDELTWHWNAGAVASWKLLDGGLRGATVREKRLEVEKARLALEQLKQGVRLEAEKAGLDLECARQSAAAGEEAVGLAEKGLLIANTRLKSGLATYLEYSDASLELSTARIAHLKALHDHLKAAADLAYATGTQRGGLITEDTEP